MYTLALPRQGRAANAGRWTDCRRTCGANSGTGEDDRKCPIYERLPPPINTYLLEGVAVRVGVGGRESGEGALACI